MFNTIYIIQTFILRLLCFCVGLLIPSLAISQITINQNWLNANGPSPYYLDQANQTYILATNVSTPGTAFAILNHNITLDLNGYTITYDNATPRVIANHSFELGSGAVASNWNFSSAPNASRHQGVFLHNEIYDGAYSLKFAVPAANQEISSNGTVTLEANTTYSLSAMFEYGGEGETNNPGVKSYVRLVGSSLPTREVSWSVTNWRGIQLQEGIFTTGNTSETYIIKVGIEGASSVAATAAYIDDIKIQRTKTYGVAVGPQSWSAGEFPGLTRYGNGFNVTVKNGNITQGPDGATWGHGIFFRSTPGTKVHDVQITIHGSNTSAIKQLDTTSTTRSQIYSNIFISNVKTITSRDAFNGAVLYDLTGDIYNNIIDGGPHAGIAFPSWQSNIYGNTINLRSRYTNGFAITASRGTLVYNNIINCHEGELACRGIGASGQIDPPLTTKVFDNIVRVQSNIDNQEYEGASLGGTYGIQLENSKNTEVYNNEVYAYGNTVPAYAFRANSDEGSSASAYVHHNIFTAISNGAHAATLKFSDMPANSLIFENNTLITNDGFIGGTTGTYLTLKNTSLLVSNTITDPFIFETDWWPNWDFNTQLDFVDTDFVDQVSKNYFSNAIWRNQHRYGGTVDNRGAHTSNWTTTIIVKAENGDLLPGANVSIKNVLNEIVASGTTDAQGRFVTTLRQFRIQGNVNTQYNNHFVTVTASGKTITRELIADHKQTVAINMDGSATPLPAVSISEATIEEGNSGTITMQFTVTLSAASESDVSINYATSDDTALAGEDYQSSQGKLTFAAGETSKTISVVINGDTTVEANETFSVNLSNPVDAIIGTQKGVGTITNDDSPVSTELSLVISDKNKKEGTALGKFKKFEFIVTLSQASDKPVTVSYSTANVTAKAKKDYKAKTGSLLFEPGQTTAVIKVRVKSDSKTESNETFFVNLHDASDVVITDAQAVGTIINDD